MSEDQEQNQGAESVRVTRTVEQQIADAELKLNRLRERQRRVENGQKIICGAVLMNALKRNNEIGAWLREWFLKESEGVVTRKADLERLQPFLDELTQTPKPDAKNP